MCVITDMAPEGALYSTEQMVAFNVASNDNDLDRVVSIVNNPEVIK